MTCRSDYRPQDVAEVYAATFAGRRDTFVAWTGSGYVRVPEPLTAERVLAAFTSRRPVGAYFLSAEATTHVGAADLDRSDGWTLGRRLGQVMARAGVPAAVEGSEDGRAHVWFSTDVLPAADIRRALRTFLADADLADAPGIELRPATDRLGRTGGVGHSLRLPTMPHKRTGRRFPLTDPASGRSLGVTLCQQVLAFDLAPGAAVLDAARRSPAEPQRFVAVAVDPDSPIARFNREVGCCAVLRRWGVPNAEPGRTIACPAHEDAHPSLSIAADDERAFCHSPGCVLSGDGHGVDAFDLWVIGRERVA